MQRFFADFRRSCGDGIAEGDSMWRFGRPARRASGVQSCEARWFGGLKPVSRFSYFAAWLIGGIGLRGPLGASGGLPNLPWR